MGKSNADDVESKSIVMGREEARIPGNKAQMVVPEECI